MDPTPFQYFGPLLFLILDTMKQILSTTEKVNLINYLLKTNSNLIFELGGTIFPNSSRGQYLDNQRRSWLNSRLKGELKLVNFYKSKIDSSLIEQFPVLIKDINLWHKCLLSVGISPYNTLYGKREYFVLDGYSRQKHFAIEADYVLMIFSMMLLEIYT
jgi:hypothetical protein